MQVYSFLSANLVKSWEEDAGESDKDLNTNHCLLDKNVIKLTQVFSHRDKLQFPRLNWKFEILTSTLILWLYGNQSKS